MKKNISNLLKFTIFISLTIFLTLKIGKIFIPETSDKTFQGITYTINGFYELEKNSIDVLFMGDSSMLRAVSPMEMWESEGITSYNYSVTAARMYTLYYLVKDALKTQSPKVIVIDPITMYYTYETREPIQRMSFDYLKNNNVKFEMMNDPSFENTFEDKASILFPILRYHSRWTEMEFDEIEKINKDFSSVTKGFVMSYAVKPNLKGYSYMDNKDESIKFEHDADYYLLKINEVCKEKGIKLMILGIEDSLVWGKQQSILTEKISKENGIDFLDLNEADYGLNWMEDTKDAGNHMNVLGAMKLTKYVTKHLKANYNLEDHRNESEYSSWHEDYKTYKFYRDKYIKAAERIVNKNKLNANNNN